MEKKNRYLPIQATITHIEEMYDATQERYEHITFAEYEVNGVIYERDIGYYEDGFSEGKVIEIRYDPEDPTKVEAASTGFLVYLIVVGTILTGAGIFLLFRRPGEEQITEEPAG